MTVVQLYDKSNTNTGKHPESVANLPRYERFRRARAEIEQLDRALYLPEYNRRMRAIWMKWDIQGGEG